MRMTWRRVVVVSVTISAVASLARGQTGPSAMSAADLVEIATQRNSEFLAAKQRIAETQGLLRRAGVRPAPAVEIEEYSGQPLGSRGEEVFSAGYFHTIETFGKRGKRVAVAHKSTEAAEADLADHLRLLTFDVKMRYAQARSEERRVGKEGRS